jgi:NADPH-dependent F420 reductase
MKLAILGGTGKLGLGLAFRLVRTGNEVLIGSRDAAKAVEAARSIDDRIVGTSNLDAAARCELAFISIPYAGHALLLQPLAEQLNNKMVIDTTVPIDPSNMLQIRTESGKSAAEETSSLIPGAEVFGAFHTISHRVLRHSDGTHDVLVAGGPTRKSEVMELIRTMGLRPIDAGALVIAGHLERMTVLLLSINKANKVKESGIKITGI